MRTAEQVLAALVASFDAVDTADDPAFLEELARARTYLERQKTTRTVLTVTLDNAGFFMTHLVDDTENRYTSVASVDLFHALQDTERKVLATAVAERIQKKVGL